MSKFLGLAKFLLTFCLLFLNPASVFAGSIQSSVVGATPNSRSRVFNITSILNNQIKPVVSAKAGEIIISSQRYCGDSDVARYYINNPQEDYGRGASSVSVAMGYWVVPSGGDQIPTPSNWFAMGYGNLPEDGNIFKLSRANSSAEQGIGALYQDEMNSLVKQLAESPKAGVTYDIYSAAMVCLNFPNNEGVNPSKVSPTAAKIAEELIKLSRQVGNLVKNFSASALRAEISFDSSNVMVDFSKGVKIINSYQSAANLFEGLNYPVSAQPLTVDDVRQVVQSQVAVAQPLIADCLAKINGTGQVNFWWESVPLELSCQAMQPGDLANLVSQLMMVSKAGSSQDVISKGDFEQLLQKISLKLMQAASVEYAQQFMQSSSEVTKNKLSCVPTTGLYINKILASLGFKSEALPIPNNKKYSLTDPGEMEHPEASYALGQSLAYHNNNKAVFMVDGVTPMSMLTGSIYQVTIKDGVKLNMHIRDVGCDTGPVFCQNRFDRQHLEKVN